MKLTSKILTLAAMAALTATAGLAKSEVAPTMYVFGFAASFNDTIVHFTDVQAVDSAWIDSKTKFLLARDNYSYQLRDYLANQQNLPGRTCVVVYNTNRTKLEKEYLKMKRQYTASRKGGARGYDVRYVNASDFRFATIDLSYTLQSPDAEDAPQQKPDKKKKPKRQGGPGMPPPPPGGGQGGARP